MSSSVWILAAAAKSWRTLNVRQALSVHQADAEVGADELAVAELQLVAGEAVDDVHAEVLPPVGAPLGLVEPLDDEDDRVDVVGIDASQALYSSVYSAEGVSSLITLPSDRSRAEDRAAGPVGVVGLAPARPASSGRRSRLSKICVDQVEVLLEVGDEDRAVEHVVAQRLADLALAAAADGAGLVAEGALADGADDAPARRAGVLFHPHLEAGRRHVDLARQQRDRLLLPVARPPDLCRGVLAAGVVGDVERSGNCLSMP